MAQGQQRFYVALGAILLIGVIFVFTRRHQAMISIPANVTITAADTSGFHGYEVGKPGAPVTVVEYFDYACPHCAVFDEVQFPDVETQLIDTGTADWVYRDLPFHPTSRIAAHGAACANDQGKFLEMKAQMFSRQNDWALGTNPMPVLTDIAKSIGLDVDAWTACMKSAKYAGRIEASYQEANRLGVDATPTFLIDGRLYTEVTSDQVIHLVDSLAAAAPRRPAPAPTPGQ